MSLVAKEQDPSKKICTARNYEQDGFIAMWDGIENRPGKHDSN